ncbi:type II toxin-antitoxin system RelE/ParE family toxin [Pararhizobium sp. YC-54]|uniref:type II toxin-antitoxin system RelE/ParE family toxin n=1 Tax=Pararhizobium sp. YC-54 TaxID=2986920 RepID=UPI0021F6D0AE|nr:type II toxin-antitoxin system RelE/ParE family toxin [Pararhizobium sp. YC-54]MCV9997748.1 type II toxin-antitoxin system RelE/ParE family toxin [Pararhizobium sp. YC-54]
MLRRFPLAGKALDVPPGVRRFSVPPYVIDYEVVDGILGVLVVRHARQHDPDIATDPGDGFEDI